MREPFWTDWRTMDDLFSRVFGTVPTSPGNGNGDSHARFVPFLDVRETEDAYLLLIDLPGVKPDDVAIEYQDGALTISGMRSQFEVGEAQRIERPWGQFVRSLTLPRGIDADKIVADYHDGVLEVHVPKPATLKPKRIALGGGAKALTK